MTISRTGKTRKKLLAIISKIGYLYEQVLCKNDRSISIIDIVGRISIKSSGEFVSYFARWKFNILPIGIARSRFAKTLLYQEQWIFVDHCKV